LPFARDRKDEPYINLGRTAKAQYLVKRDAALLNVPIASDRDSRRIREEMSHLGDRRSGHVFGLLQQASK
jgi:hypothetical protein